MRRFADMTLVLTVLGTESIFTVADRRLTNRGRIVGEDARKIMNLETTNGAAILAYAGLGSTKNGTEPSDWMSAVLRGRNWPLEQALNALAEAFQREMPTHLAYLPVNGGPSHNVLISAFVDNEPRLYSIDMALSADRKQKLFRYTRWSVPMPPRTPRFGLAGSGAVCLQNDRPWQRLMLTLVKEYERQRISALAVADALAAINYRVSNSSLTNGTVGPKCIVAWKTRKDGVYKGGGGHQCYTATVRDKDLPGLPTIGTGMDMRALCDLMMGHFLKGIAGRSIGEIKGELIDINALRADVAKLPSMPDETLR
jgi:hypothetical protein